MKGECLCGEVKFSVKGELPNFYQCHCSLCRKTTGSSANAATFVSEECFEWISGSSQYSLFSKANGLSE